LSHKETAVNVLLGALLLSALAAPFAGVMLAFYGVDQALKHFFPALAHRGDVAFYGLMSLSLCMICLGQLRKRLWTNLFLSSTASVSLILPRLLNTQSHSPLVGFDLRFQFAWFLVFFIPQNIPVSRNQFLMWSAFVVALFADNAGLLGSGWLSTTVEVASWAVAVAWSLVTVRADEFPRLRSLFPANA
jgi:hypothetical protein